VEKHHSHEVIDSATTTDAKPASSWRRDLFFALFSVTLLVILLVVVLVLTGTIGFGADPMAGT